MDSGTNIQLEVGKTLGGVRTEGVKCEPSTIKWEREAKLFSYRGMFGIIISQDLSQDPL